MIFNLLYILSLNFVYSTGTFDNLAATEPEALDLIKRWLSYLPSNRWELPPVLPPPATQPSTEPIVRVIPNDRHRPYNPRDYLQYVVDEGTLFEMGTHWGKPQGTFFARVNGKPVAVTASDPRFEAGALTDQSCNKLSRFVSLCSTFVGFCGVGFFELRSLTPFIPFDSTFRF